MVSRIQTLRTEAPRAYTKTDKLASAAPIVLGIPPPRDDALAGEGGGSRDAEEGRSLTEGSGEHAEW